MAVELESWERPRFEEGHGDPFLFYVIYGTFDSIGPVSRKTYRTEGIPDGIKLSRFGPGSDPEVPGQFREGYLWDEFRAQSPQVATAVSRCNQTLVLRGTPVQSQTLDYLRDVVGFITCLVDQGACAVYDPLMFRWWPSDEWRQTVFEPAAPVPHQHTVILTSEESDSSRTWFHTRGLRKFGRPDISVHDVPSAQNTAVIALCNRLIVYLAEGGIVTDGQKVQMDGLPGGAIIHHSGDLDDPDFNNVHLNVQLNVSPGGTTTRTRRKK